MDAKYPSNRRGKFVLRSLRSKYKLRTNARVDVAVTDPAIHELHKHVSSGVSLWLPPKESLINGIPLSAITGSPAPEVKVQIGSGPETAHEPSYDEDHDTHNHLHHTDDEERLAESNPLSEVSGHEVTGATRFHAHSHTTQPSEPMFHDSSSEADSRGDRLQQQQQQLQHKRLYIGNPIQVPLSDAYLPHARPKRLPSASSSSTIAASSRTVYKQDSHRKVMLLLNIWATFWAGGLYGLTGSAVKSLRDFYGITNAVFNATYWIYYVEFVLTAPLWMLWIRCSSLRTVTVAGSMLLVIGYLIQMLYRVSFWFTIVGAVIGSLYGVMLYVSAASFMARWFSPEDKAMAYGSSFVAGSVGGILSFTLARTLLDTADHFNERYIFILIGYACTAFIGWVLVALLYAEKPAHPPGPQAQSISSARQSKRDQMMNLFQPPKPPKENRPMVLFYLVVYVWVIGAVWAVGSLTTELWTDRGWSDRNILIAGLLFSCSGIPTPLIVGYVLGKTHKNRIIVCSILCILTAVYLAWILTLPYTIVNMVVTAILGLSTGAMTLTFAETVSELAFPATESSWTLLMFIFGNISAVLMILLASWPETVDIALWMFFSIFAACAIASGFALIYKTYDHRLDKSLFASHRCMEITNEPDSEGLLSSRHRRGDGQASRRHSRRKRRHHHRRLPDQVNEDDDHEQTGGESTDNGSRSSHATDGDESDNDTEKLCERCGKPESLHVDDS